MNEPLLQAVKSLCKDHSACVLYLDSCLQGVKQTDMKMKVGDLNVNCLLYADDAVPIASSECDLKALVTTLKGGCENNNLSLNENITKVLVFEKMECKISVNGKILEQGNEVVYLVSMFSRDGRYEMDVDRGITAGNMVNRAFAALMERRNVSTAAQNTALVPLVWAAKRGNYKRITKER